MSNRGKPFSHFTTDLSLLATGLPDMGTISHSAGTGLKHARYIKDLAHDNILHAIYWITLMCFKATHSVFSDNG